MTTHDQHPVNEWNVPASPVVMEEDGAWRAIVAAMASVGNSSPYAVASRDAMPDSSKEVAPITMTEALNP